MAILTSEKFGGDIRCWLDTRGGGAWREVTALAVRINIPAVEDIADLPPLSGMLMCSGSIDLLMTDNEGCTVSGGGDKLLIMRCYGMIKLIWNDDQP